MTRLFLKITGLILLAFLLVLASGWLLRSWLEQENILIAPHRAPDVIADRVVAAREKQQLDKLGEKLAQQEIFIALTDEQDKLLYAAPQMQHMLRREVRRQNRPPRRLRPNRRLFNYSRDRETASGERLRVEIRSHHPRHRLLQRENISWMRATLLPALLAAMLIASLMISFFLTRPLRSLRRTMQTFGAENFTGRVDERVAGRRDAIGELGQGFNRMADRLEDSQRSQQQLLRDVSHELRSPLARIQVANTLAQQKTGDSSELQRIDLETARLDNLIGTILQLTRLNDLPGLEFEAVDIKQMLEQIVQDAQYEYQHSNKRIALHCGELPMIDADFDNLSGALENVVRNAMCYTNAGTTVTVRANIRNQELIIEILDQGQGVPDEHLLRLFEPFFRSDSSRNENTGSNGVGLAITRRIIELHRGRVSAQNAADGGLLVTAALPVKQKPAKPTQS